MEKFLDLFSKTRTRVDTLGMSLIPFESSIDTRIDLVSLLELDFDKNLLVYCGVPFSVRGSAGVLEAIDIGGHEILSLALFMRYVNIHLNFDVIPPLILDVVFFHELREVFYRYVLGESAHEAHQKALLDEIDYVNSFLTGEEKQVYNEFVVRARA